MQAMRAKEMQNTKYFKIEYKKHLYKTRFPLILYGLIFVGILFLLLCGLRTYILPIQSNVNAYAIEGYEYVVESSAKYEYFTRMYKLDNLVSIYSSNGKHCNVNYYMQDSITRLDGLENIQIGAGEIVVSEKLAERLCVDINDVVEADLPISDSKVPLTIVAILPYINDYYEALENVDFSVAIIGYDEVFESSTSGKYIYFLSAQEKSEFDDAEMGYRKVADIITETKSMEEKVQIAKIISYLIIVVVVTGYLLLIKSQIWLECKKYYYDVVGVHTVKKFYWYDNILYYGIPMVVFYMLLWCVDGMMLLSHGFYWMLLVMNIIHFVMIMIGGNRFGKTHRV